MQGWVGPARVVFSGSLAGGLQSLNYLGLGVQVTRREACNVPEAWRSLEAVGLEVRERF